MRRRLGEAGFHCVKRQVRRAEFFPRLDLFDPILRRTLPERDPSFDADAFGVAARRARVAMNRRDHGAAFITGTDKREPAVAEPPDALEHRVGAAAEPNGDRTLSQCSCLTLVPSLSYIMIFLY